MEAAVVVYALVNGAFCAWLADEKGRSGLVWFFLGLFFFLPAMLALGFAPHISARELEAERRRFSRRMDAEPPPAPRNAQPWDPSRGPPPE